MYYEDTFSESNHKKFEALALWNIRSDLQQVPKSATNSYQPFNLVQYFKDQGGIVSIKGNIKG